MIGNWFNFYKLSPKIRGGGAPHKKIWGQNMRHFGRFVPSLQALIANISGTGQDIENRNGMRSRAIPSAFDKKGPVNFGHWPGTTYTEFHVSLDPLKWTFWEDYISALKKCCSFKFLHELEIDPGYLAHTRSGTGVHPKIFYRENLKCGLKFSVL